MKTSNTKERLKILVNSLEITQKELAIRSGVREASISHYIQGLSEPNQKSISKIAEAVQISPAWLMGYGPDEIERM